MSTTIYNYKLTKPISSKTYFPVIGLFIFGVGCFVNPVTMYLGMAALLGLAIILTTKRGIEIDITYKTFKIYWTILGFKKASIHKYNTIAYTFIQSARVKQSFYSASGSHISIKQVFNGYIKFSEDVKIPVIQADDKEAVIRKLQLIAMDLNLEIIDFTDPDSISIFPGSRDTLSI